MNKKMTTAMILDALRKRHSKGEDINSEQFAFFDELRFSTGGFIGPTAIDAWAMAVWPSLGFETYSFEVKVSRGDFLRELRNPGKRKPSMLISNYYYFVISGVDVATPSEIPEGCGLMVAGWNGDEVRILTKLPAPLRKSNAFTERFVASILRRAARIERIATENEATIIDLGKEVEELRDVIEFYAKQDNWVDSADDCPAFRDMGHRAREARGDPPAEGEDLDLIKGGEHA